MEYKTRPRMVSESLMICICTEAGVSYQLSYLGAWALIQSSFMLGLLLYSPMVSHQSQTLIVFSVISEKNIFLRMESKFYTIEPPNHFFFHQWSFLCFAVTLVPKFMKKFKFWIQPLNEGLNKSTPSFSFLFFNRQPKPTGTYNNILKLLWFSDIFMFS